MPAIRSHLPMTSALDAIEVILTLLDREPDTTLAALLDHLPGGTRAVVPVPGGDAGPAGVATLAALLSRALPAGSGARVALVSIRHSGDDAPEESDLAVWRQLARTDHACAFELLDWFVVTDEAIVSLAELAGPPARWAR